MKSENIKNFEKLVSDEYSGWLKKYLKHRKMKLISMTAKVVEVEKSLFRDQFKIIEWQGKCEGFDKITNYANFLKLPLQLGFFVPCDEEGDVLEEPDGFSYYDMTVGEHESLIKYQQAKERVIFEGFEYSRPSMINDSTHVVKSKVLSSILIVDINKTIETLISNDLTLTQNAIKTYKL